MTAPMPDTETARLDALRQCYLLDTAPEESFDDLARLAAQICGTPIAAVSLIDADRQWFKSILGLAVTESPREEAFCAHTILRHNTLIVPDAAEDDRFSANPHVTGDPNIRFYAGAPLVTAEGHALGSLCVIDRVPRQLTPEQVSSLEILARQVVSQIELTRRIAVQERLIDARQQAEAALRRSEARMAEAQKIAQIGDWEYDVNTQEMIWSDEMFRILGFDPAQPMPTVDEVIQHYHPDDLPARNAAFALALTGTPYEMDMRVLLPGGHMRWCQVIACPFQNHAGETDRIAGTLMDVTERKEAAAALQQANDHLKTRVQERTAALQVSEERYRFMADAMPQIVWTATPDGSVDYYNRRWYEYTGLTFEQTKDWEWEAVIHPEDLQNCVARWTHSIQTGVTYEVEYRFQRAADSTYRWHLGRAFPLRDPSGQIIQWVGGCTDIHDHKEAEQALRLAHDELEGRVRQRTADLAEANHALREDQKRLSEITAIQHEIVHAELDLTRVMTLAAESAQSLTRANGAVVELAEGDELVDHVTTGCLASKVGTRLKIAGSLSELCVQTGQTLRCDDSETDPRTDAALCRRLNVRSMIIVPLRLHDENKGVIKVMSPEVNAFNEHDVQALDLIAGLIATAMNRAAQFETNQTLLSERTAALEAQRQAQQELQSHLTHVEYLNMVLNFQREELKKTNAELEALATMDGLTNLRNRRAFDARLREEFERATRYQTPLSLVLLDIDHFKHYNDTFGHQAGDEALRVIGLILQKATRETDIVARYGGEEMALILPETDGVGASHVAEQVRMAIATALWDKREVTASMGISTLRLGMARPDEMIASADRALYQSKADGRNRITHGYNLEPALLL